MSRGRPHRAVAIAAVCRNGRSLNAIVQPAVADRRLRIDVLLLGEPGDRGALVAELVDELERRAP